MQRRLQASGRPVRLELITTTGDRILDRALDKVGGKGLFLKEIERALLQGKADLAVHSLKDVPMVLPAAFRLAAVLPREDPRDAWVASGGQVLADLPAGARIGTSSLRRAMMLRRMRPDLQIAFIRGNIEGRLAKLASGEFAAIVLALAGLRRLGLEQRVTEVFEPSRILPAVGQGAIAIETCSGRADLEAILAPLNDRGTELCVSAERAVGRHMDAGCSQPFAAYARLSAGVMHLEAAHQGQGDAEPRFAMASAPVSQMEQALSLGEEVAGRLRKT